MVCVCVHITNSGRVRETPLRVFFLRVCVVSKLFSGRWGWVRVGCLERLEGFEGFVGRETVLGGVVVGSSGGGGGGGGGGDWSGVEGWRGGGVVFLGLGTWEVVWGGGGEG